jgi:hypothetical protein
MRPKIIQLKTVFYAILAYILTGFTPALAQAVTVQSGDEFGHGFMVRQGSTCYVLLPKHVAAGQRRVTVFSAAPVVHSGALVETPFWDGMDLAIGVVRGAIEKRCTVELSSLDISAQPESGTRTQLLRLRQSGEPERIEMLVTDSQYLTLEAEIADGKSELFKGTSGAFLFAENKPLGMVIEALSPTKGRFIRIEEIYQNVARRVSRRAGFSIADADTPATTADDDAGLAFQLVSATLPPITPDRSESNLDGSGSYVFQLTRPNRMAFQAAGGKTVSLSQVRLRADTESGYAVPRDIRIDVSSSPDGQRTRPFYSGEMPSDGVLVAKAQPTRARWVFVTVASGWDSSRIGLDAISFH